MPAGCTPVDCTPIAGRHGGPGPQRFRDRRRHPHHGRHLALLAAACSGRRRCGTSAPSAAGPASSSPAAGSPRGKHRGKRPRGAAGSSATAQVSRRLLPVHARSNGVPKYPDPASGGQLPKGDAQFFGVSDATYQTAGRTCQHLLPTSGSFDQLSHDCIECRGLPVASPSAADSDRRAEVRPVHARSRGAELARPCHRRERRARLHGQRGRDHPHPNALAPDGGRDYGLPAHGSCSGGAGMKARRPRRPGRRVALGVVIVAAAGAAAAWRTGVFSPAAASGSRAAGRRYAHAVYDQHRGAGRPFGDHAGERHARLREQLPGGRAGRRHADLAAVTRPGDQPGPGALRDRQRQPRGAAVRERPRLARPGRGRDRAGRIPAQPRSRPARLREQLGYPRTGSAGTTTRGRPRWPCSSWRSTVVSPVRPAASP